MAIAGKITAAKAEVRFSADTGAVKVGIRQVERELKGLQSRSSKMANLGAQVRGLGEGVTRFGRRMSMAGVAAAAPFALAAKSVGEFDRQFSSMLVNFGPSLGKTAATQIRDQLDGVTGQAKRAQMQLGQVKKMLGGFRNQTLDIATELPVTPKDVAKMGAMLARGGLKPSTVFGQVDVSKDKNKPKKVSVIKAFAQAASVMPGEDPQEIAEGLLSVMKALGKLDDKAGKGFTPAAIVNDVAVLAKATTQAKISITELTEALKFPGGVLSSNIQLDPKQFKELVAVASILKEGLASSSIAGTSLRGMTLKLRSAQEGDATDKQLNRFGLDFKSFRTDDEKGFLSLTETIRKLEESRKMFTSDAEFSSAVGGLFDTRQVGAAVKLLSVGADHIEEKMRSLDFTNEGAVDFLQDFADELNNNVAGSIGRTISAFQKLSIKIGDTFKVEAMGAMQGIINAISMLTSEGKSGTSFLQEQAQNIKRIILGVGAVVALGAAISAVGVALSTVSLPIIAFGLLMPQIAKSGALLKIVWSGIGTALKGLVVPLRNAAQEFRALNAAATQDIFRKAEMGRTARATQLPVVGRNVGFDNRIDPKQQAATSAFADLQRRRKAANAALSSANLDGNTVFKKNKVAETESRKQLARARKAAKDKSKVMSPVLNAQSVTRKRSKAEQAQLRRAKRAVKVFKAENAAKSVSVVTAKKRAATAAAAAAAAPPVVSPVDSAKANLSKAISDSRKANNALKRSIMVPVKQAQAALDQANTQHRQANSQLRKNLRSFAASPALIGGPPKDAATARQVRLREQDLREAKRQAKRLTDTSKVDRELSRAKRKALKAMNADLSSVNRGMGPVLSDPFRVGAGPASFSRKPMPIRQHRSLAPIAPSFASRMSGQASGVPPLKVIPMQQALRNLMESGKKLESDRMTKNIAQAKSFKESEQVKRRLQSSRGMRGSTLLPGVFGKDGERIRDKKQRTFREKMAVRRKAIARKFLERRTGMATGANLGSSLSRLRPIPKAAAGVTGKALSTGLKTVTRFAFGFAASLAMLGIQFAVATAALSSVVLASGLLGNLFTAFKEGTKTIQSNFLPVLDLIIASLGAMKFAKDDFKITDFLKDLQTGAKILLLSLAKDLPGLLTSLVKAIFTTLVESVKAFFPMLGRLVGVGGDSSLDAEIAALTATLDSRMKELADITAAGKVKEDARLARITGIDGDPEAARKAFAEMVEFVKANKDLGGPKSLESRNDFLRAKGAKQLAELKEAAGELTERFKSASDVFLDKSADLAMMTAIGALKPSVAGKAASELFQDFQAKDPKAQKQIKLQEAQAEYTDSLIQQAKQLKASMFPQIQLNEAVSQYKEMLKRGFISQGTYNEAVAIATRDANQAETNRLNTLDEINNTKASGLSSSVGQGAFFSKFNANFSSSQGTEQDKFRANLEAEEKGILNWSKIGEEIQGKLPLALTALEGLATGIINPFKAYGLDFQILKTSFQGLPNAADLATSALGDLVGVIETITSKDFLSGKLASSSAEETRKIADKIPDPPKPAPEPPRPASVDQPRASAVQAMIDKESRARGLLSAVFMSDSTLENRTRHKGSDDPVSPYTSMGVGMGAGSHSGAFRANGGPVKAGGSYIVGEKGPELFFPTESGHILSNGLSKKVDGMFADGTIGDKEFLGGLRGMMSARPPMSGRSGGASAFGKSIQASELTEDPALILIDSVGQEIAQQIDRLGVPELFSRSGSAFTDRFGANPFAEAGNRAFGLGSGASESTEVFRAMTDEIRNVQFSTKSRSFSPSEFDPTGELEEKFSELSDDAVRKIASSNMQTINGVRMPGLRTGLGLDAFKEMGRRDAQSMSDKMQAQKSAAFATMDYKKSQSDLLKSFGATVVRDKEGRLTNDFDLSKVADEDFKKILAGQTGITPSNMSVQGELTRRGREEFHNSGMNTDFPITGPDEMIDSGYLEPIIPELGGSFANPPKRIEMVNYDQIGNGPETPMDMSSSLDLSPTIPPPTMPDFKKMARDRQRAQRAKRKASMEAARQSRAAEEQAEHERMAVADPNRFASQGFQGQNTAANRKKHRLAQTRARLAGHSPQAAMNAAVPEAPVIPKVDQGADAKRAGQNAVNSVGAVKQLEMMNTALGEQTQLLSKIEGNTKNNGGVITS